MAPLGISHNPDDLVDWIWVVLAFAAVVAAVGAGVIAVVRAALTARSSTRDDEHTR